MFTLGGLTNLRRNSPRYVETILLQMAVPTCSVERLPQQIAQCAADVDATHQSVVAKSSGHRVSAIAAVQFVVVLSAIEQIVSRRTGQRIVVVASQQTVIATPAQERVILQAAVQDDGKTHRARKRIARKE